MMPRKKQDPKCPHCGERHTPQPTWCGGGPSSVTLALPIPTSTNRMYRRTKTGRVFKASKAETFGGQVMAAVGGVPGLPYRGPVHVTLAIYRPRKSGDIDNYLKVLFDALEGVVFRNDSQVHRLVAFLDDSQPQEPGVRLVVEPILGDW